MARTETLQQVSVSLKQADGYSISDEDALIAELQRVELLSDKFLYHAFRPQDLRHLLKTGWPFQFKADKDVDIFCFTHEQLGDDPDGTDTLSIIDYMAEKTPFTKGGMIAVYDRSQLTAEATESFGYSFKNSEDKLSALIAIVTVSDFWDASG